MTIKLKVLRRILQDYEPHFPGWGILGKSRLVRANGPILQGILFDRSSDDKYRPTGYIRVLTAPEHSPGVMGLIQDLNHPNGAVGRSVHLKSHEREREEIARELRRQLVPAIDRPLEVPDVLQLYEREAVPTAAEAYSLATLRAYLGHETEAKRWSARFRELQLRHKHYWNETDYARNEFIDTLERWLDSGVAREKLEQVIQDERRKLGLA